MVLSVLAVLLGTFFTATLALLAIGVSIATSESGGTPILAWLGAGITFLMTLIVLWRFIPAYQKQKKREEWDDRSKGIYEPPL